MIDHSRELNRKEVAVYALSTLVAIVLVWFSNNKSLEESKLALQENNKILIQSVKTSNEVNYRRMIAENKRLWVETFTDALSEYVSCVEAYQHTTVELIEVTETIIENEESGVDDSEILLEYVKNEMGTISALSKSLFKVMCLLDLKDPVHRELYSHLEFMKQLVLKERIAMVEGEQKTVTNLIVPELINKVQNVVHNESAIAYIQSVSSVDTNP